MVRAPRSDCALPAAIAVTATLPVAGTLLPDTVMIVSIAPTRAAT